MASENNNELSNGWTQYQKLVLAELTRHESAVLSLKEENISHKVIIAQINQSLTSIKEDIAKIRETQVETEELQLEQEQKLIKQKQTLEDKFNEQKLELEKLKWKVGASLAIFVFILNAAVQLAAKTFKFW